MPVYRVKLEKKVGLAQDDENIFVRYHCETYSDSWVGARTVCRLGTSDKRVFRADGDGPFLEAAPFTCGPSEYIVRHIFVENTRKKGKKRMGVVTGDQLLQIIEQRKIKTSAPLRAVLTDLLAEDGIRVTQATLRRLGLAEEEAA